MTFLKSYRDALMQPKTVELKSKPAVSAAAIYSSSPRSKRRSADSVSQFLVRRRLGHPKAISESHSARPGKVARARLVNERRLILSDCHALKKHTSSFCSRSSSCGTADATRSVGSCSTILEDCWYCHEDVVGDLFLPESLLVMQIFVKNLTGESCWAIIIVTYGPICTINSKE
jgi:hypothetical protein